MSFENPNWNGFWGMQLQHPATPLERGMRTASPLLTLFLLSYSSTNKAVISTNTINLQEQLIHKDLPSLLLNVWEWNLALPSKGDLTTSVLESLLSFK